jgi:hypothetical protein
MIIFYITTSGWEDPVRCSSFSMAAFQVGLYMCTYADSDTGDSERIRLASASQHM